jgi:hypothetical protein
MVMVSAMIAVVISASVEIVVGLSPIVTRDDI